MELKIVTGMSGAGKTNMVQLLEDMGYYCVDNLPPNLFGKFVDLLNQAQPEYPRAALVADVRGGRFFADVYDVLQDLKNKGTVFEIIFLEASDEVLVRRFKETRRRHPMAKNSSVLDGIREERRRLQRLRGMADVVIDTSNLRVQDFKERAGALLAGEEADRMLLSITSFGYKYGLPIDVDLVLDARFLPNPYYVADLKPLSGLDEPIKEFVLNRPQTQSFLDKYCDILAELLPQYLAQGKHHLSLAVGCTGGRHRSVAVAEEIARRIKLMQVAANLRVAHRDIDR